MKVAVNSTFNIVSQISSSLPSFQRQKTAIMVIATAAVLAVAGCGGVNAASPSPTPTPTPNNGPSPTPTPAVSSVNVPTWHMDNGRSGLNSNETQLTPATVNA